MVLTEQENQKKLVGEAAVKYIENGMIVGLGSGSTVNWMLQSLAKRIEEENLQIECIPTSKKTEKLANELGIPLIDESSIKKIDLAIDGADEVDPQYNLVKGGGGSLVREKIIDTAAKEFIVIADESKLVSKLGAFKLPVEVIPFGWELTAQRIEELGGAVSLRNKGNGPFISDNGNYILDCDFGEINNPAELHHQIKSLVGVVETGLFVGNATKLITVKNNEVMVIDVT